MYTHLKLRLLQEVECERVLSVQWWLPQNDHLVHYNVPYGATGAAREGLRDTGTLSTRNPCTAAPGTLGARGCILIGHSLYAGTYRHERVLFTFGVTCTCRKKK